jgi:hypothetical protein
MLFINGVYNINTVRVMLHILDHRITILFLSIGETGVNCYTFSIFFFGFATTVFMEIILVQNVTEYHCPLKLHLVYVITI